MASFRRRKATSRKSPSFERKLDIVVVGHTNVDHFFHVERLPTTDRTVPLRNREVRLGGTAGNIARAAARLGVRTGLISQVGLDFPARFRRELIQEGIDLSGFETVSGTRSPAVFIIESASQEQVTLIDQGPMEADQGAPVPRNLLARASWVHLTTGNPGYQLRVLETARSLGLRAAADPAQEIFYRWNGETLRRLLLGSEVFFGNRGELAHALELLKLKSTRELLSIVPMVIETLGPDGAVAWTRAGRVHAAAVRPRGIRQVTGAGDGFRGGFYAGWFRGDRLEDCLRYGTWAAARWLETGDPSHLRPPGSRPHPPADLSAMR
jgi:sugar/nucleoside kinase (ribokinase family)